MRVAGLFLTIGFVAVSTVVCAEVHDEALIQNPSLAHLSESEARTTNGEDKFTIRTGRSNTVDTNAHRLALDITYECDEGDLSESSYDIVSKCHGSNLIQSELGFDFSQNTLPFPIAASQNQQILRWREPGTMEVQYGKHTCRFRSADLPMVRIICAK